MKLSVCIEPIGSEMPFVERIGLAAAAGFTAVEFWNWQNKDIAAAAEAAKRHGVAVAAFVGSGNKLVDPGQRPTFLAEIRASIETARLLACPTLIVTAGAEQAGVTRQAQHDSIVAGLRETAPLVEDAGITLVLEPLNVLVNHKGHYLSTSAEGFQIVNEVGSPAVRLLFDIYHQQITEGNVTANMTENIDLIGHLHLADVPGRHEPGSGELNYVNILQSAAKAGYAKYAGLEYKPLLPAPESLRQVRQLLPDL